MSHPTPLSSAWAKMDWANKHVDRVEGGIRHIGLVSRKLNKGPVSFGGELADDGKAWIVEVQHVTRIPAWYGLLVADAVHNFRAVLDHIVWELAFIDGGCIAGGVEPKGNVQFPLIQRTAKYPTWRACSAHFDREAKRLLENVSKRHRAMIKRHQPYHAWPGDEPHPFAMLSDLDNDDKHRVLQPVYAAAKEVLTAHPKRGRDCETTGESVLESVLSRPLEVGTKIMEIPIRVTGPDPHMGVKAQALIYVGFRNGEGVVQTLRAISRKVRAVYADFFPEFERPKAKRVWYPREGRIQTPPPASLSAFESESGERTVEEIQELFDGLMAESPGTLKPSDRGL